MESNVKCANLDINRSLGPRPLFGRGNHMGEPDVHFHCDNCSEQNFTLMPHLIITVPVTNDYY